MCGAQLASSTTEMNGMKTIMRTVIPPSRHSRALTEAHGLEGKRIALMWEANV